LVKTEKGKNMSALPNFTMTELMEAGVHFGHKTMRWNAKMAPFIFGARNNIHIIDLQQTVPLLHRALEVAKEVASKNGRILFVATKPQASQIVNEAAERCGQYFVNFRWMGGMLTNWGTVSQSIKRLKTLEANLADEEFKVSKKERLTIQRDIEKLNKALGGIREMGGKPDLVIVIDTNKEKIAVQEANKLGIPVVAIVDTNCDPEGIDHIVPGNDDSIRAIRLYCNLFSDAILSGIKASFDPEVAKQGREEASEKSEEAPKKKSFNKAAPSKGGKPAKTEAKAPEKKEVKVEKKISKVKKA
jgi:small subunit ribosomal protein S2